MFIDTYYNYSRIYYTYIIYNFNEVKIVRRFQTAIINFLFQLQNIQQNS